MLLLKRPSAAFMKSFVNEQSRHELSYKAIGASAVAPPTGYVVDHTRILLGRGAEAFRRAKEALERWEQFHLGWVEAWPADTPIKTGADVAVLARIFRLYWLNACRIVYVVNEEWPMKRFGFAYGTLPDHAESGEERFTVEWRTDDDSVWYDILAFSRPRHFLARLGYLYARRLQKRFARDSVAAMQNAVRS